MEVMAEMRSEYAKRKGQIVKSVTKTLTPNLANKLKN